MASTIKNNVITLLAVGCLLVIWQVAAGVIGARIILPTPYQTIRALFEIFFKVDFWHSVGATFQRGIISFLFSLMLGLIVGITAGLVPVFRRAMKPFLVVIRTTPVLSIILLALIWFKTETVSVFVSFLVVFPIITENVITGIHNLDRKLLVMANLYKFRQRDKFFHIILPSLVPFLLSASSVGFGLVWKVVVAAEVLSLPRFGIGSGMQTAQIHLETARVFAWTSVAILLSFATEGVLELIFNQIPWRRERNVDTP